MNPSQRIDELSRLTAGLSQSDFEALALRLNPREKRVYEYLRNHGDVCSLEIRRECDIGNISCLASRINHKLEAAGIDVRMVCFAQRATPTRYEGEKVNSGWWRLAEAA